jgi:hypothetical protein
MVFFKKSFWAHKSSNYFKIIKSPNVTFQHLATIPNQDHSNSEPRIPHKNNIVLSLQSPHSFYPSRWWFKDFFSVCLYSFCHFGHFIHMRKRSNCSYLSKSLKCLCFSPLTSLFSHNLCYVHFFVLSDDAFWLFLLMMSVLKLIVHIYFWFLTADVSYLWHSRPSLDIMSCSFS